MHLIHKKTGQIYLLELINGERACYYFDDNLGWIRSNEKMRREEFYSPFDKPLEEDMFEEMEHPSDTFTGKVEDDSKGRKYDGNKPMAGTLVNVFPRALLSIGAVIRKGQEKYPDPNNWKKVEGANKRYQDSLMRHLIKHNMDIEIDDETGLPHLVHAAWNSLAILELYLMEHQDLVDELTK